MTPDNVRTSRWTGPMVEGMRCNTATKPSPPPPLPMPPSRWVWLGFSRAALRCSSSIEGCPAEKDAALAPVRYGALHPLQPHRTIRRSMTTRVASQSHYSSVSNKSHSSSAPAREFYPQCFTMGVSTSTDCAFCATLWGVGETCWKSRSFTALSLVRALSKQASCVS
jgi:hypothetical protein